jgi:hypothetical protein
MRLAEINTDHFPNDLPLSVCEGEGAGGWGRFAWSIVL